MPRSSRRLALAWIERTLFLVAALFLGAWTAVIVEARLYGFVQERRLARLVEARRALEATPPPAVRSPVPGADGRAQPARAPGPGPAPSPSPRDTPAAEAELVGRIEIPRLRLRAIVAEGVDARTLRRAVGHLPGSPLPGQGGNVVIAGHRDTFFQKLKDVRAEDIVRITTPEGRFEYVVEATGVVEPTRTDVLAPTAEPSITLVTCYPFYLVGEAPDRFVVRARLLSTEGDGAAP